MENSLSIPRRSISCSVLNTEEFGISNTETNISLRSVASCKEEHIRSAFHHGVEATCASSDTYENFLKFTDGVLVLSAATFIISSIAYLTIWGYGFYFSGWGINH